ncbi:phosphoglycerate kinase [Variovorax gracilis]|uniref:phosphoglycerate kinase n=1 Tax=Variovorax gracilis TaxID=3053502 RepID=UPI00336BDAF0
MGGRSKERWRAPDDSLAPAAMRMPALLGQNVRLVLEWVDAVCVQHGQVVVLENCRLNMAERQCDEHLSRKMASLCEIQGRASRCPGQRT